MDSATQRRTSAFSIWLRTGLWPKPLPKDAEYKFNPWHDPENGQFTFGPGGGSFGGGGATSGGGGATGSWDNGRQVTPAKPAVAKPKANDSPAKEPATTNRRASRSPRTATRSRSTMSSAPRRSQVR